MLDGWYLKHSATLCMPCMAETWHVNQTPAGTSCLTSAYKVCQCWGHLHSSSASHCTVGGIQRLAAKGSNNSSNAEMHIK
jgi:hypothetical protein